MKRLAVLFVVLLVGCNERVPAEKQIEGSNPELKIEVIGTFDGYRIIRFRDGGYSRYAVLPTGTAAWTERCGKGCARSVSVPTVAPK